MLKHENEVDSKLMQRARTINHKPQSILIFKEEKVSKSILAYFTFTFSNTKGTSYGHVSKSHDMVDMHVCPTPPHNLLSLRTCRTPQTNKKKKLKILQILFPKKTQQHPHLQRVTKIEFCNRPISIHLSKSHNPPFNFRF